MQYTIKVPAVLGEVASLHAVACVKANRAARADDEFHKPAYDGSLRCHISGLVTEAKRGRLVVCNQHGHIGSVDDLLAECGDQLVNIAGDESLTIALNVYVSIRQLNFWADLMGDVFAITHDAPWIDERGWRCVDGTPPSLEFTAERALTTMPQAELIKDVLVVEAPASELGKVTIWTDARKAEARTYRQQHGLKKTAAYYQVSQATISKHIPAGKPQKKSIDVWGGLTEK